MNTITLDLWFGELHDSLSSLYLYKDGLFDCWHLDSLLEDKKSPTFSEEVYLQIARSSKVGTTLTTNDRSINIKSSLHACGFILVEQVNEGKSVLKY